MLYSRMRRLAAPSATIFVCDHTPKNDSWPAAALYMTEQEQLNALMGAGFEAAAVVKSETGWCSTVHRPRPNSRPEADRKSNHVEL
jgi:hypothetical protein